MRFKDYFFSGQRNAFSQFISQNKRYKNWWKSIIRVRYHDAVTFIDGWWAVNAVKITKKADVFRFVMSIYVWLKRSSQGWIERFTTVQTKNNLFYAKVDLIIDINKCFESWYLGDKKHQWMLRRWTFSCVIANKASNYKSWNWIFIDSRS